MSRTFPPQAIEFLRSCVHDPDATRSYELISGSVSWSDEEYDIFFFIPEARQAAQALFVYRTSLIEGRPREAFRYAWDEARLRAPEWIGLRPERCTPSAELQQYLRDSYENF